MDYKEKYEQALEVAQRFYNNSVAITKKGLEDIFPELKESIDERIKKVIKQVLSESTTEKDECYLDNGVTQQEVFAWLEAQGEQKPAEWTAEDEEELKIALNTLEKAGQYSSAKWLKNVCLVPQTTQKSWSEEDENLFRCAIDAVKQESKVRTDGCLDEEVGGMVIDWLKSLKDRVQPKQEWSEEDEKIIETMCKEGDLKPSEVQWLKSLRPQSHWKPSYEQMEYLAKAIVTLGDKGNCKTASILNDLRLELKKLREE